MTKIKLNAKIKLLAGIDKKPFELNFYKFGELIPKTKKLLIANRTEGGNEKLPPVPKDNMGCTIFDKIRLRSLQGSRKKTRAQDVHILGARPKNTKGTFQTEHLSVILTNFGEKPDEPLEVRLNPDISCTTNPGKVDQDIANNSLNTLDFSDYQDFPALKQLNNTLKIDEIEHNTKQSIKAIESR